MRAVVTHLLIHEWLIGAAPEFVIARRVCCDEPRRGREEDAEARQLAQRPRVLYSALSFETECLFLRLPAIAQRKSELTASRGSSKSREDLCRV